MDQLKELKAEAFDLLTQREVINTQINNRLTEIMENLKALTSATPSTEDK